MNFLKSSERTEKFPWLKNHPSKVISKYSLQHLTRLFKGTNEISNVHIYSDSLCQEDRQTAYFISSLSFHVLFFCLACALTCPFFTLCHTTWMLPRFMSSSYHFWFFPNSESFDLMWRHYSAVFFSHVPLSTHVLSALCTNVQFYNSIVSWWPTIGWCIHTGFIHSRTRIHEDFNYATPVFPLFRSCVQNACMFIVSSLFCFQL